PLTDFGGKTSIFSHPVYLFLRKFSLQDFRGGSLLGISKRGDKNLRRLLVQCARSFIQRIENQSGRLADWVRALLARKHSSVVCCALANKLARIAWAITTQQTVFER
ncbi:transposase, partial [Escherichia coli]